MSSVAVANESTEVEAPIPGERRTAIVSRRFASLQAKVQNALALAVVVVLGGGFLVWYYSGIAESRAAAAQPAKPAGSQGEMHLPPLGPAPHPYVSQSPVTEQSLGMVDGNGNSMVADEDMADGSDPPLAAGPAVPAAPVPDPELQRRLEAPVLIREAGSYSAAGDSEAEGQSDALSAERVLDGLRRPGVGSSGEAESGSALVGMLQPTRVSAVAAGVMPDRRFLLSKGAFIDCTLETAIDSTLPGMTTCVIATDVWSADGAVVLLERGTKLVGDTRGEVRQGQQRLFVLWSEARTPAGVVVELASPGTDEIGRSGVTGFVDTHFGARFGAAILISLIDAGTAALVASQSDGGSSVVIAPQGASDVVSEVLRQTVDIRPTIRVAQGGRMQVLVARDVSFAQVYALAHR
jgi:type IV secretion system protein VirB10